MKNVDFAKRYDKYLDPTFFQHRVRRMASPSAAPS